ncbi:TatD family hydrolase [Ectothiorhodospiraceae bacterium 2226]|nr:TatD family hydrolase [Ectothiorhodospiraceae bacterium 2226]
MLVDSHCHLDRLDLARHDGRLDQALDSARAAGVGHMLCVCIDLEHYGDVHALAAANADVSVSVGVHPTERDGEEPSVARLVELGRDPRVVAIGETGLDYFRCEPGEDMEWQRERFRRHIAAARTLDKPLIIHMRDATDDTLRLMKEEGADAPAGVMHCFVEDWETAARAMELGFYISFSGIVTFRSAKTLQEVAARMPLERMLIETDSPYLAPVPFRGKSNEPAYVGHVAQKIAELRGVSAEAVAEATTENFFRLFKGARTA